MKMDCIESIDIKTNNKDIITISSCSFENFYIANLDENGDEINYLICDDQVTLYANFFMIKLLADKNEDTVFTLLSNIFISYSISRIKSINSFSFFICLRIIFIANK